MITSKIQLSISNSIEEMRAFPDEIGRQSHHFFSSLGPETEDFYLSIYGSYSNSKKERDRFPAEREL